MEVGYQNWGTCEVSTFYSRKTKGAKENGSRIRHPAFLFAPRFVSPAIIVHTTNARIAADSAAPPTNLIAFHGFADINKRFSPNVALAKEGLITLDATGKETAWKAAAWPAGGSCPIVLKDANDKETEAKVRAIFSKWAKQENSPIKQIVTRDPAFGIVEYRGNNNNFSFHRKPLYENNRVPRINRNFKLHLQLVSVQVESLTP